MDPIGSQLRLFRDRIAIGTRIVPPIEGKPRGNIGCTISSFLTLHL